MLKFNRPEAPIWLAKNQAKWTKNWLNKKSKKKKFTWATHVDKRVNVHLNELFQEITDITPEGAKLGHCCFCDGYPMATNTETIEHFKPTSRNPELAYHWENLFYACQKCQEKNDNFDELLLKPDLAEYDFYEYFIYLPSSGELKPNPNKSLESQSRAIITIELYGLNRHKRPQDRKRVFDNYYKDSNPQIDDYSYRFLFL